MVSYDKYEQKYGGNITISEIPKDSKGKAPPNKQDHYNKFWYNKFEDIINLQHVHGGRTGLKRRKNKQLSYCVKNQCKIYRQFLQDEHTLLTPERNSAHENIGFVCMFENGNVFKGPISKKKIPDD